MLFEEWLATVGEGVAGYVTPKVAVAAVVGNEQGEILLTQRADSGMWLYPVGWADVGLLAVGDRGEGGLRGDRHRGRAASRSSRCSTASASASRASRCTRCVFHCRMLGGELRGHPLETRAVGFFGRDDLPRPLAGAHRWVDVAFKAIDGKAKACDFDPPRTPPWRGSDLIVGSGVWRPASVAAVVSSVIV